MTDNRPLLRGGEHHIVDGWVNTLFDRFQRAVGGQVDCALTKQSNLLGKFKLKKHAVE